MRHIARYLRAPAWLATGAGIVVAMLAFASPAAGTFPGTNGKIAYTSEVAGQGQVFTINPDGSGETNVSRNDRYEFAPAWSPDGTRIAFTVGLFCPCNIYAMNADGSGRSIVTQNVATDLHPAWSPDGGKIAFHSSLGAQIGGNYVLYSINSDGMGQTRLTTDISASDTQAAWSPDGTRIAFTRFISAENNFDVFVINADGSGGLTRLTDGAALDASPSWSPDGQKIAFSSGRDGNLEIYTMNPDGSEPTRLTNTPAFERSPVWSPDGTKIAFSSGVSCPCTLHVMNADASGQTQLSSTALVDPRVDWGQFTDTNSPPECSTVNADPNLLWPHNNHFRLVTLAGATDPDGDAVTLEITGVTQDEPVSRRRRDRRVPDARRGSTSNEVFLRAERDRKGDGRVYRIAFTVSDGKGGSCSGTATVSVPRRKKQPAVDSAPPSYDSFGSQAVPAP